MTDRLPALATAEGRRYLGLDIHAKSRLIKINNEPRRRGHSTGSTHRLECRKDHTVTASSTTTLASTYVWFGCALPNHAEWIAVGVLLGSRGLRLR
jgi:hypothetical protein